MVGLPTEWLSRRAARRADARAAYAVRVFGEMFRSGLACGGGDLLSASSENSSSLRGSKRLGVDDLGDDIGVVVLVTLT